LAAAPFGPGAAVEVTSSGKPVSVFVARLRQGEPLPLPDTAFVKVGKTPLVLQLPPGSYQVEVQGFDVSNQGVLLEMRAEPRRLLVRPGSEGLGMAGTLMLGAGVIGIVGGLAILLSGSKGSEYNKAPVLIPMFAGGGVLLGAGLGMSIASNTAIDDQSGKPTPAPPRAALGGATLSAGFSF
jgi:hypothetical protein